MAVRQDAQRVGIPAICESCEARHGGLCGALEAGQLAELARASSRHEVLAGTELPDDGTYSNVLSGVVKLTRNLSDGRQQIVGFHFAPDFLGRPFEAKRPIKAEALTKMTLCSFPRAIIDRMMGDTPEIGQRLLQHALNELDEARDWMTALGHKTASEKVASFLLMIARNIDPANHPAGSTSFDLPLSRADIADFLGLTIETVSRELSRLRSDGVIRIVNKRHISLESVAQLEERRGD
ncbi:MULTISPECIES: Crp/Fnr family transcriptional regulator [unclassified Mesorhizobium]|uniref:Crp/Fnr family transcriptional regulator n=1 Tax=unclassified Mesorhizobium TaxID=325217 RepID=UPI000F753E5B|nr:MULTISPECIES: Crp/Fnr family transcriptional regulator [unclassified Mesorhizobium]AZO25491.1 Crp/Fnr family transcriptional regulator [Mesorhizobium sp. M1E.F.Ca.ET.045.02.1.1]RUW34395.1 Crp/Fnr family transcriptional regulator [Mesorhizobium sp. M1E.F.Ca.ET.041.01.1.1]RWD88111.1 MAG: Crp/Fnr family transcriptional regulator [Mesorhizobium sp.]RWD90901.1 MAG: Crp/Fnr family transcriptional regulator [Mesorhizobium sp.]TIV50990.1 MAG: Crp/Fnr family transcriptional regulator [Mesorhizobium 